MKANVAILLAAVFVGGLGTCPGQHRKIEEAELVGVWEERARLGDLGRQVRYKQKIEAGGKITVLAEKINIEPGKPTVAKVELKDVAVTTWKMNAKGFEVGPVSFEKLEIEAPRIAYQLLHCGSGLLVLRNLAEPGDLTVMVKSDTTQKAKVVKKNSLKLGKYTFKGSVIVGLIPERSIHVTGSPATAMWVDEEKHINYAVGKHLEYHEPSKAIIVRGSPAIIEGVMITENKNGGGIAVRMPDGTAFHRNGVAPTIVGREPTEKMDFSKRK